MTTSASSPAEQNDETEREALRDAIKAQVLRSGFSVDETADAILAAGFRRSSPAATTRENWVLEIDYAEDATGKELPRSIGPFESREAGDQFGRAVIRNGEWGLAKLTPPWSPVPRGDE